MKKRLLAVLLIAVMAVGLLAGCGKKKQGNVLNVYVWNDEFVTRVADCYPGYTKVSATEGKIGDVTVKWIINENKDNNYQNKLDVALEKQDKASADDKVDIFLVEADYALKYVDSDYTMALEDLGIKNSDLANQFKYTQDVMTDSNGKIKGSSWQGCPAGLIYNRDAAKAVLGTDDPAKVQEAVKDWDTFLATAEKMKAAGYYMCSSVNDTYRVFSNNTKTPWVKDGKINVDKNIEKWIELSKTMATKEYAGTHDLWGADWSKGFYPDGKVFCYFGPAWFIDFSMNADQDGSIGKAGGWGLTVGPQAFFWGGTWVCAAKGTDNADLVKDIILKMTTDKDVMTKIVKEKNDFVNNKPAMEEMAKSNYTSKVLGGQNPLPIYLSGIGSIDLSNITGYDQGCNEKLQNTMKNYFLGTSTLDEALAQFKKDVKTIYPELKID